MNTQDPFDIVTKDRLLHRILSIKSAEERLILIGISGFAGSGKSTLAAELGTSLIDSVIVPIDDFIVGPREQRSDDWRTFDRERLRKEVLDVAKPGEPLIYKCYNSGEWVSGEDGRLRRITPRKILIIEGCGVLHPSLMRYYDYSAWIALEGPTSWDRAKKRDKSEGNDNDRLWGEIWAPNDQGYFDKYRPDRLANVIVEQ